MLPVPAWKLWFGLLGGPAAWTAHLLASYPLVPLACHRDLEIVLYGITALTGGVALAASLVAWHAWKTLARHDPEATVELARVRRARFMALSGAVLSGFFFIVTLVEGLPVPLQNPCDLVPGW